MPGDSQDPDTIRHYNVFALTYDIEPGFLEGANGIKMVDT